MERWLSIHASRLSGCGWVLLAAVLICAGTPEPSAARADFPSLGSTPSSASAKAQSPLERRLAAALASAGLPAGGSGAAVIDLLSGDIVFAHRSKSGLVPASNEKLPLTFAALRVLGVGFEIETEALGVGSRAGATWDGNLVLRGNGDPHLSSADLSALAHSVRATGIRTISGDLVGDESFFDSRRAVRGWKRSFLVEECPPLSALIVDRGRYQGTTSWTPALTAALLFKQALAVNGVSVLGRVRIGVASETATPLASVFSPPLWKLLRFMDRTSDNFTAELLLKQLGASEYDVGTSANGAAVLIDTLEFDGIPTAGVRIVDGSGLSSLDRLTPQALVTMLEAVWAEPGLRKPFLNALAVAGKTGTLSDRLQRPRTLGKVFAKTGTTRISSALSGYVKDRYAFAILQNGNPVSAWKARLAQDRFVSLLAAQ